MVGTIQAPLFVPANRPDRFEKASASEADAVILDLEDAVAEDEKSQARGALTTTFTEKPVLVRINSVKSRWFEADLAAVAGSGFAAVMLAKAEDPGAIADLARLLGPNTPIVALIESASGFANARTIAALPTVVRLAFGSIDFCADLGCAHEREILLPARFELVLASKLAGIAPPLDGVTARLDEPTETFADARHARDMGMTGKLCIHPKQIAEVRRAFQPGGQEVAWARRVLAAGGGAVSVEGMMVDEPVRIRARAILASADGSES